jgi:hypothetical protein
VTAVSQRQPPAIKVDTPIGPDADLEREDIRLADGTRLTGELAEAIVEDVRRTAGRPSLSGGRKRSPQVSARITPELRAELDKYSKSSGMSASQVLRHALEELMAARTRRSPVRSQKTGAKSRRQAQEDPAHRR